MNRTPAEWSKVSPDAVASGSWAQARNVLEMALQDIARMASEIERLKSMVVPSIGSEPLKPSKGDPAAPWAAPSAPARSPHWPHEEWQAEWQEAHLVLDRLGALSEDHGRELTLAERISASPVMPADPPHAAISAAMSEIPEDGCEYEHIEAAYCAIRSALSSQPNHMKTVQAELTAQEPGKLTDASGSRDVSQQVGTPTVEDIARTICLSYGRDPDEQTSIMEMCTADNRPVPVWMVYEEQAEAIMSAYSVTSQSRGAP